MKDSYPCEPANHKYIKGSDEGVKKIEGASALAFKGIKKGTSTSVDKHGVAGSWKDA